MTYSHHEIFVLAARLTAQPSAVLLVLGGALIVLGGLRLFGFLPRPLLSRLGRRLNPMVAGSLMIVLGGLLLIVVLVR